MRGTVWLLIVLIVGGTAAEVSSQAASEDQAIMEIVVSSGQEFIRRGTAFHVGNGVFYTNVHVVKDRMPDGFTDWYLVGPTATRSTDTWLGPFSITCVHPLYRGRPETSEAFPYDVARLLVPGAENLPFVKLSTGFPNTGMRVRTRGFPAASRAWPPVLYTALGRIAKVDTGNQTFQVDVESGFALGGSSGSPVIAPDNTVLGIHYASYRVDRTAADVTFAISVQAVRSGCPPP
jgi:V8-like Glu-specific endopeptidase